MNTLEKQYVQPGGTGGKEGVLIDEFPKQLENFLVAGGAAQDGTNKYNFPSGRATFTGKADADNTVAFTAKLDIFVSNDPNDFPDTPAITIDLSGTGTGGVSSVVGNDSMDAPWSYVWIKVRDLTGVGANAQLIIGM